MPDKENEEVKQSWDEDPELGDENDPAYREEMFRTFLDMGWTEKDIREPKYKAEYAEWLKNNS